ncbi:MAG: aconitate hydratase [Bacteroidetes bacterium CG2_30_33_31]|nr:MAG: aconitate hydratase [Bacteroidetes bacterium CG2_30_33_31]
MLVDINLVRSVYKKIDANVDNTRKRLGHPLTLAEKILYSHLYENEETIFERAKSYVNFKVDRVAMQDATAQMALLQFMNAGKKKVAVPSSVHCDHLIQAYKGSETDLSEAIVTNKEVYDFLESVSNKYGIGFWKPGAGIIHQVVLENYAFPGGLMIGTDSHTVNAGGLGMVAVGVGGADAVDVMADMPWELKFPKLIGIKLTGKLNGWTAPKDIILKVAGILTVKGGTGAIVEYFGEGAESISATGKATICNMGAEIGATNSIFAYDSHIADYLKATNRGEVVEEANKIAHHLRADAEVYSIPEKYYDQVVEINLDKLLPHLNGPFTPDRDTEVGKMGEVARANNWPLKVEWALIGSCTNSSYEDLSRAASIAKQAVEKGLTVKAGLGINPGSEQVRFTAERDGLLNIFQQLGATIFTNACGPCIGQWKRDDIDNNPKNTIVHSFNRNFTKRADGNPNTHAFVASPEMVTALAIAGNLDFNPLTDSLINNNGEKVKLDFPNGFELPPKGFDVKDAGYKAPAEDGSAIQIVVDPKSSRLQLLAPFAAWNGKNYLGLNLLIKAKGKCTTDHISMAGSWLKYRGHLDNISNNLLIGAINNFNGEANKVKNQINGEYLAVPDSARAYKAAGHASIIVGDENYGEGSSREHAAMEPRNLGVMAVLVRSFARIHETNLKKQGLLALTFADAADYEKIMEDDRFDILGMDHLAPGKALTIVLHHANGTEDKFLVNQTLNQNQIDWFIAGSALNLIRKINK